MPAVVEDLSAEILPEPRPQAPPSGDKAPNEPIVREMALRALEREARRELRLSDR